MLPFICCDSMRYFCVEANQYRFFYRLLIYVLQLGSSFVILYTYVFQWFIEK